MTDIQKRLFELQDHAYGDFHSGLIPELPREYFIGVRVPVLKKFVKEYKKEAESETFLKQLPHTYYEEYMVHILLLGEIKDYDTCMKAVEEFLPYIDNWAICDVLSPKVFKNHKPELLEKIKQWIPSEHTYICRFGIEMLMRWFLDEDFKPEYLKMPDAAIPYLQNPVLEPWTHNKTIQKARESFRITPEQKEYLKTLKVGCKKSIKRP